LNDPSWLEFQNITLAPFRLLVMIGIISIDLGSYPLSKEI